MSRGLSIFVVVQMIATAAVAAFAVQRVTSKPLAAAPAPPPRVEALEGEAEGAGADTSHSEPPQEGTSGGPGRAGSQLAALLDGNIRFSKVGVSIKATPADRKQLIGGQHPSTIVLGCSDSRVPPELVFNRGLGELFVIRTAGHVLNPEVLGSIEYAVEHLHAKTLVVLGHERCGAVTAALAGAKPTSENVEALIGRLTPALEQVPGAGTSPDRVFKAVEANVRFVAKELLMQSPLLAAEHQSQKLRIVQAVYSLESGRVRELK